MHYDNVMPGIFLARPNRFVAHVEIDGKIEIVHVKNTGRCRELLPMGAKVWCQQSSNPGRKTKYDLISVQKGMRIINMDSQAPNAAVGEWLAAGGFGEVTHIRPEVTHGNSRFDYSFRRDGEQYLMEVKGVTLENDGVCAFPDAPTLRGTKHLKELTALAREGHKACVLFVIQMENVLYLHPNDATDPAFATALREAAKAGIEIIAMDCCVTPDSMALRERVFVRL